jgi:hypothetical protein
MDAAMEHNRLDVDSPSVKSAVATAIALFAVAVAAAAAGADVVARRAREPPRGGRGGRVVAAVVCGARDAPAHDRPVGAECVFDEARVRRQVVLRVGGRQQAAREHTQADTRVVFRVRAIVFLGGTREAPTCIGSVNE